MREANESLEHEEDECDEPELPVDGGEVRGGVGEFVVFDYDEGGEEGEGGGAVEEGVVVCCGAFLGWVRVGGGLEEEDCLGCEEEGGYV